MRVGSNERPTKTTKRAFLRSLRFLPSSVQRERVQLIVHRDEHVLMAVDRVGLRGVRRPSDARVPERLPCLGVTRDEVSSCVAAEEQATGGGQQATRSPPA